MHGTAKLSFMIEHDVISSTLVSIGRSLSSNENDSFMIQSGLACFGR